MRGAFPKRHYVWGESSSSLERQSLNIPKAERGGKSNFVGFQLGIASLRERHCRLCLSFAQVFTIKFILNGQ
jgi:hypothetical protein